MDTLVCSDCARSSQGLHKVFMCGRRPNPINGEPQEFCNTQRLVHLNPAAARRLALELDACGPDALYFQARTDPEPTFLGRVFSKGS